MKEHLVGRTPRLSAYFIGLSLGLALLAIGIDQLRIVVIGELRWPVSLLYSALGAGIGLLLAFVFGYLNGGILASWAGGTVSAAGRVGELMIDGSWRLVAVESVGAIGIGVLVGAFGFALAIEKHRLDRRTSDLPVPPSRPALFALLVISALVGGSLLFASTFVD